MAQAHGSARVPAIGRAAAILRVVSASPRPLSLSEITKAIGAPKSSVMGICQALAADRIFSRGTDGRYWLGVAAVELGAAVGAQTPLVRRIGLTVPSVTNDFYLAELRAARLEAAQRGIQLVAESADYDTAVQARQIDAYVASGVDLVIVDPVTSHGLEEATAGAREAGIPVVAINANAIGADLAITTDNSLAGALAARYLGRTFTRPARIAIVDGMPVTAIADRVEGFREALRSYPQLSVVAYGRANNDSVSSERVASEILAEHPNIDAFFAVNDPTSVGVAAASERAGRSPKISSVDGSADIVKKIVDGSLHVSTSSQSPTALVASAFRLGIALCSGFQPAHGTVLLPSEIVSAENAKEYEPW
ncbi:substrate-binding domain-containing protein [Subtercola endophyticus]|uniref:substrate-binding domain-containing protein n=1 Tax=Subtercola endophyticus TaxID=2895559 RepID=UPI001E462B75|nr:substrate-binding domain-containing protein [Subtercola endophyticus]UFS58814.1 substrate-binding domain-containing protein [Subtercola endophyticus]